MGRMLEALKRGESKPVVEPGMTCVAPAQVIEEQDDPEMPFIEVGGPRKPIDVAARVEKPAGVNPGAPGPRLEIPPPRQPVLHVCSPQSVTLQPAQSSPPSRGRIAAELVAFHQPNHPVSKQYAALFAQIMETPCGDMAPAFLFTALAAGAGTTTSVLNLAISGSLGSRKRVVVLDANAARPAATVRLGVSPKETLIDVLGGKIALERAVVSAPIENLHLVASTIRPADASSLTSFGHGTEGGADALRWVLSWLQQRFDAVLVDAPAWQDMGELRSLLSSVTAVYLVVDAGESDSPAVRGMSRETARLGSRLGGLVVTS